MKKILIQSIVIAISIISLIVAIRSTNIANKSLDFSKKAFNEQQRAYLILEPTRSKENKYIQFRRHEEFIFNLIKPNL